MERCNGEMDHKCTTLQNQCKIHRGQMRLKDDYGHVTKESDTGTFP